MIDSRPHNKPQEPANAATALVAQRQRRWMDSRSVIPLTASKALLLVWVAWVLGPACFVFCSARNDGEPDCLLALVAVVGHGSAVLLTVVMTALARVRRLPEYWFMLSYWVPLAGLFLGMSIESSQLVRASLFTVLGWAALIPLAGVVRLIRLLRGVGKRR